VPKLRIIFGEIILHVDTSLFHELLSALYRLASPAPARLARPLRSALVLGILVPSFHSGVLEDKSLLGYDTVSLGERFATFRKTVVPSSSRVEGSKTVS
jgi:hypothetical protein